MTSTKTVGTGIGTATSAGVVRDIASPKDLRRVHAAEFDEARRDHEELRLKLDRDIRLGMNGVFTPELLNVSVDFRDDQHIVTLTGLVTSAYRKQMAQERARQYMASFDGETLIVNQIEFDWTVRRQLVAVV